MFQAQLTAPLGTESARLHLGSRLAGGGAARGGGRRPDSPQGEREAAQHPQSSWRPAPSTRLPRALRRPGSPRIQRASGEATGRQDTQPLSSGDWKPSDVLHRPRTRHVAAETVWKSLTCAQQEENIVLWVVFFFNVLFCNLGIAN